MIIQAIVYVYVSRASARKAQRRFVDKTKTTACRNQRRKEPRTNPHGERKVINTDLLQQPHRRAAHW